MSLPARLYPRIIGAATCAYGAFTVVRPQSLVDAAQLPADRGSALLATNVGARDVLSGLALLLCPPGPLLRAAVAARVAADACDVLAFGWHCPPQTKLKAVAIAGGWAGVCATAYPFAGR